MKISPIIQPEAFVKLDSSEVILIDASAGSKARYDENHLLGALYLNLDNDLADIKDFAIGGRHPLPQPKTFGNLLGNLGISEASHVIIYDDKNNSNAAARLWWMLKAIGHEKVQVINGGFQAAIRAGAETTNETTTATPVERYPIDSWKLPLADMEEVELASKNGEQTIVDVRSKERYQGLTEPIDLIAGHIPGAINIPFTENLEENGYFLAPEVLKKKYETALVDTDPAHTIVHCGSGVTACHMLLAMDYAGMALPKLYVGSWGEWSRNGKDMVLSKL